MLLAWSSCAVEISLWSDCPSLCLPRYCSYPHRFFKNFACNSARFYADWFTKVSFSKTIRTENQEFAAVMALVPENVRLNFPFFLQIYQDTKKCSMSSSVQISLSAWKRKEKFLTRAKIRQNICVSALLFSKHTRSSVTRLRERTWLVCIMCIVIWDKKLVERKQADRPCYGWGAKPK